MSPDLKQQLRDNQFGPELLHNHVDRRSFDDLCGIFKQDRADNGEQKSVDGEVVYFIIELICIMRYRTTPGEGRVTTPEREDLLNILTEFEQCMLNEYLV